MLFVLNFESWVLSPYSAGSPELRDPRQASARSAPSPLEWRPGFDFTCPLRFCDRLLCAERRCPDNFWMYNNTWYDMDNSKPEYRPPTAKDTAFDKFADSNEAAPPQRPWVFYACRGKAKTTTDCFLLTANYHTHTHRSMVVGVYIYIYNSYMEGRKADGSLPPLIRPWHDLWHFE